MRRWARSSWAGSSGSMPASASGSSKASEPKSSVSSWKVLAVVLHRLFELAGVEPVALAFRAAVDHADRAAGTALRPD